MCVCVCVCVQGGGDNKGEYCTRTKLWRMQSVYILFAIGDSDEWLPTEFSW